ncbi:MAG: Minf_1886 family protein [Phycisphaerae bacterium]
MPQEQQKKLESLIRVLGRYPPEAFEFLQMGLDYTVQKMHGPPAEALAELHRWLDEHGLQPHELADQFDCGDLPDELEESIGELGGPEAAARLLNRHVGGAELCAGLRDVAIQKWGLMASTVLRKWGIFSTRDFGRMVFALVENGLLQKQPRDCVEDFDDVYDFDDAFDQSFRIGPPPESA